MRTGNRSEIGATAVNDATAAIAADRRYSGRSLVAEPPDEDAPGVVIVEDNLVGRQEACLETAIESLRSFIIVLAVVMMQPSATRW
jgi:hypothetical protein